MSTKTIGDYILNEKIGKGSFAVVYKAKHKVKKELDTVYTTASIYSLFT